MILPLLVFLIKVFWVSILLCKVISGVKIEIDVHTTCVSLCLSQYNLSISQVREYKKALR